MDLRSGRRVFGLWLAAAVVAGKPDGLLRRVVSSASGVLAYFAGVPLAFVWIATLGRSACSTVLLKSTFGFDLSHALRHRLAARASASPTSTSRSR